MTIDEAVPMVFSVIGKIEENMPPSIYMRVYVEDGVIRFIDCGDFQQAMRYGSDTLEKLVIHALNDCKSFLNSEGANVENYLTIDVTNKKLIPITNEEYELYQHI